MKLIKFKDFTKQNDKGEIALGICRSSYMNVSNMKKLVLRLLANIKINQKLLWQYHNLNMPVSTSYHLNIIK